ncbi:MAG: conjugal transfer protein TrbL [Gemmatimonadetes bacterium]|nr:conjugal transfer protein TrbL [Gemmatimonadota bacterium]
MNEPGQVEELRTHPRAERAGGIMRYGPHSDRNAARAKVNRLALRVLALAVAGLFVTAIIAPHAAGQQVVSGMTEQWRQASLMWGGRLLRSAQRLFVLLAGFEVVASAMVLLLGSKRLDEAAGGFVIKILVMSLCFFAMTSFELIVPPIFDSFVAAGQQASLVPSLNPAQVAGIGILTAGKILAGSTLGPPMLNTPLFIIGMIVALLVLLAFAGIACQIVYCLVEGYVVMSAGLFFLGFASFRGTATLADNYLTYVMHCGIKVMMLYLLVPIGSTIAQNWPPLSLAPLLDMTAPFEMLMGSCVFCGLVMFLPGAFASKITGGASLGIAQALRNN